MPASARERPGGNARGADPTLSVSPSWCSQGKGTARPIRLRASSRWSRDVRPRPARAQCPHSLATTRSRSPGVATLSSCMESAGTTRGAASMCMGTLSSSRPCLVKTNRRFVTWQPEQMKVWCSQPRHAPYRREPRSSGSTRRHTRCNASLTLRPALTRRAALVLGRYLTRLRLRPTRHVDRLGLRRSLVRC